MAKAKIMESITGFAALLKEVFFLRGENRSLRERCAQLERENLALRAQNEELAQNHLLDPMTGLWTERRMQSDCAGKNGFVVFSDMNNMGQLNKRYDSFIGDAAIAHFAGDLKKAIEKCESETKFKLSGIKIRLYRKYLTGDEFLFFIETPSCGNKWEETAKEAADFIRGSIGKTPLRFDYDGFGRSEAITGSVGDPEAFLGDITRSIRQSERSMQFRKPAKISAKEHLRARIL